MYTWPRRIITLLIGFLLGLPLVSAATFPFTDVKQDSPYYSAVKYLFDARIITDDGSHLFHPIDTINRDTFVGLSVSVSCKKCISPTTEDVIHYQTSPFIDLTKSNTYFYCIAYAAEKNIVQWYIPDQSGKSSCQDKSVYSSNPFCQNNKTSRIEASAVLMRQAGLWNDTLNRGYIPKMDIADDSLKAWAYWRGYAEKWLQVGLLSLRDGKKIYPDEYISRGEYALMAGKMLSYNQCQTKDIANSIPSEIGVRNPLWTVTHTTSFPLGYTGTLVPITPSGSWNYGWTLTHPTTNTTLHGSGTTFPINKLSQCGTWIGVLEVIDPLTGKVVSTSEATFFIQCPTVPIRSLSLIIEARPLTVSLWQTTELISFVSGNTGSTFYSWNLGDATTASGSTPTHTYTAVWIYTVTLVVTDSTGNTAVAQIVVEVIWDDDLDDDWVPDRDDACPTIVWKVESRWCPPIIPFDPYSPPTNPNNPPGTPVNPPGNPNNPTGNIPILTLSTSSTPISNLCIIEKAQTLWAIIAEPTCDQCPCSNKIELLAMARSCDILFPTILSLDKQSVYSRGGFYQIP